MPRFRKKPVVVEAIQFGEPAYLARPGDFPGVTREVDAESFAVPFVEYSVVTIHGERARLADGDWIITEPDGAHHYPCKSDIFAATYEPADERKPIREVNPANIFGGGQ